MPRVSAIITSHNREHFLREALDSILGQTFHDFEIIIVDDGSTIDIKKNLYEYLDKVYYIRTEGVGRSEARNAGIRVANGEYIGFLDDDDIWLPPKLEKQVRFLDTNPHFGLAHTFTDMIDEYGNLIRKETNIQLRYYQKSAKKDYTYERLTKWCPILFSSVLVRKSCLQKFDLFDSMVEPSEDWDFCLRFALKYRIGVIREVLARYRLHKGQSSKKSMTEGRIKTVIKHLDLVASQSNFPNSRKIFYNFYLDLANAYYIDLKPTLFHKVIWKALEIKPLTLFNLRLNMHLLMSILPVSLINKIRFFRNNRKYS